MLTEMSFLVILSGSIIVICLLIAGPTSAFGRSEGNLTLRLKRAQIYETYLTVVKRLQHPEYFSFVELDSETKRKTIRELTKLDAELSLICSAEVLRVKNEIEENFKELMNPAKERAARSNDFQELDDLKAIVEKLELAMRKDLKIK